MKVLEINKEVLKGHIDTIILSLLHNRDMYGFELYSKIKSKNNKIKVLFLIALRDLHNYDNFKN